MSQNSDLKFDIKAGFSVALVALPLSIGIALASGAPAASGIIAAIIGGVFGSFLGGTNVTINGPAAGLIVIVLDAVMNLGYKGMLAACVAAAAIQIVLGFLKFAKKCLAFPTSVIHGMMAAIGLIIIAKQLHTLMGYTPQAKNPLLLYAEIPQGLINMQPLVFFIGASSLIVLLAWNKFAKGIFKNIPGPLMTVIFGAVVASFMGLDGKALLNIPSDISTWFAFPDFHVLTSFSGWKSAVTLALVGSLETTLSAAAVDKLDPKHRHSNLDRDLISKGVCNLLSASIGGLPMIAEIVRSSANVAFGAITWRANFVHGIVVALAVAIFPNALVLIPLTSLAAILVMVGGRLGNPSHLLHAYKIGKDNFVGFATTLFVTLSVDLLYGIICGAIAQFFVEVYLGLKLKNALKAAYHIEKDDGKAVMLIVDSSLAFSNFLTLKDIIINKSKNHQEFSLDLSHCHYIDGSVIEQIDELSDLFKESKIDFKIIYSPKQHALGADHLSSLINDEEEIAA